MSRESGETRWREESRGKAFGDYMFGNAFVPLVLGQKHLSLVVLEIGDRVAEVLG